MKHRSLFTLAVFVSSLVAGPMFCQVAPANGPIDRHALVSRHNIVTHQPDPMGAMGIGNGDFAYNFDVTGMQSFPEYYAKTMPIGILSSWGWHSFPNPHGYTLDTYPMVTYKKGDGKVIFPYTPDGGPASPAAQYLRGNPQKFGLGRIGLEMTGADGKKVEIGDLQKIEQTVDLWTGIVSSSFEVDGVPVHVKSAVYGTRDEVGFVIESPLIASGKLKVLLAFPYALDVFGHDYQDWTKPDAHKTVMTAHGESGADFARTLDSSHYYARTRWSAGGSLKQAGKHQYLLSSTAGTIEFSAWFSPRELPAEGDDAAAVLAASQDYWKSYWMTGGAIDLSGNSDPRAAELERRIVLSQWLMKVHDGGSWPPAETGLAMNSWWGKYHMEMYFFHCAHWALWGHSDILEKSLTNLQQMMPEGEKWAKIEGAKGVKWSKMTDPSGEDSPSPVGPILVWEQPHAIYMAELVYRAHKAKGDQQAILERYKRIVFESADYMASFVYYDPARKQYVLGPGVAQTAEKNYPRYDVNLNPSMEVGYWKWGLQTAQVWRVRLGLPPDPLWANVIKGIAPPTVRGGVYVALEKPEVTNAAGIVSWLDGVLPPDPDIDKEAMRKTTGVAGKNQAHADWFLGVKAMASTRQGDPESAVNDLATSGPDFNTYMPSGYSVRGHDPTALRETPVYMPANGALLAATAMMAAGYDGATQRAPGFPKSWKVKFEGLNPVP